jgi:hypothetical protein
VTRLFAFFDHLRETTINHLEDSHDDDVVVVVVAGMPLRIPAKMPFAQGKLRAKMFVSTHLFAARFC